MPIEARYLMQAVNIFWQQTKNFDSKLFFSPILLHQVRTLRRAYDDLDIEVDGGVGLDTIDSCANAGANMIVSGTAVIKSPDPAGTMSSMKQIVTSAIGQHC